jgi:hypothetical protein
MVLLGPDLSAKIAEIREKNKVEAAVTKAVMQAEIKAEEARLNLHREIFNAWDKKCQCRANKWCKTTAPEGVKVFKAPTSLAMTEEMLIMSLRMQALARDYEKSVDDSMGI